MSDEFKRPGALAASARPSLEPNRTSAVVRRAPQLCLALEFVLGLSLVAASDTVSAQVRAERADATATVLPRHQQAETTRSTGASAPDSQDVQSEPAEQPPPDSPDAQQAPEQPPEPLQFEEDVVVVVGSRAPPRSVTESMAPIDAIPFEELASQGETDVGDQLRAIVPSYNVNPQPVGDAARIIRPANLRGLAPDHTLVLVNGLPMKSRKLYTAIHLLAIERLSFPR